MANSRTDLTPSPIYSTYACMAKNFTQAATATALAHPARVAMNIIGAGKALPGLADFGFKCRTSFLINFTRGTSVFWAQRMAQDYSSQPTIGFMAAGVAIGTTLETWLVRHNNRKDAYGNDMFPQAPRTRFGFWLTTWYMLRELGFYSAVGNNHASEIVQAASFSFGVIVTTATHKLIVTEAMRGMHAPGFKIPKLSDGFSIPRKIANGDYHCFAIRTPKPATFSQRAVNVAVALVPPKLLACRLAYLAIYKGTSLGINTLFANRHRQAAEQLLDPSISTLHSPNSAK